MSFPTAKAAQVSLLADTLFGTEFQAELSGSRQTYYNALFGPSQTFQLDFDFPSLAPTSFTQDPSGIETSLFALNSLTITAGNGRVISVPATQFSVVFDDNFSLLTASLDGSGQTSELSVFSENDTELSLSGFKFDFLVDTDPSLLGLSSPNLAVFNYLNELSTPLEQGFHASFFTEFNSDGERVDVFSDVDILFGNFRVLSNPAVVPIPPTLLLMLMGLFAIALPIFRRRKGMSA